MLKELKCKLHLRSVTHVCTKHVQQLCISCKPAHLNCPTVTFKKFEQMVLVKIGEYQNKIKEFSESFKRDLAQNPIVQSQRSVEDKLKEFTELVSAALQSEQRLEAMNIRKLADRMIADCDEYIRLLEKNKQGVNVDELSDILSPDLLKSLQEERDLILIQLDSQARRKSQSLTEAFLDKAFTASKKLGEFSEKRFSLDLKERDLIPRLVNQLFGTSETNSKPSQYLVITDLRSILQNQKGKHEHGVYVSGGGSSFVESHYRPSGGANNELAGGESTFKHTQFNRGSFRHTTEIRESTFEDIDLDKVIFEGSIRRLETPVAEEEFEFDDFSNFEDDIEATLHMQVSTRVQSNFDHVKGRFKYFMRTCTDDIHSPDFFDLRHQKQIVAYLNYFSTQISDSVKELIVSFAKL